MARLVPRGKDTIVKRAQGEALLDGLGIDAERFAISSTDFGVIQSECSAKFKFNIMLFLVVIACTCMKRCAFCCVHSNSFCSHAGRLIACPNLPDAVGCAVAGVPLNRIKG